MILINPSRAVNGLTAKCNIPATPDPGKMITLVAGKRCRLFLTGDDDEVFVTRSLNVRPTPKTTEQQHCAGSIVCC